MDLPEIISVKDIQNHLGISKNRAYDLIKLKGFPRLQLGHRFYIPKDQYLKWIDDNLKTQIIL